MAPGNTWWTFWQHAFQASIVFGWEVLKASHTAAIIQQWAPDTRAWYKWWTERNFLFKNISAASLLTLSNLTNVTLFSCDCEHFCFCLFGVQFYYTDCCHINVLIPPAGGAAELVVPSQTHVEQRTIPRASPDLPFPSAAHTLSASWALSLCDWTEPLSAHLTLSLSCTWLCFHSPFSLLWVSWLSLSTLFEQR